MSVALSDAAAHIASLPAASLRCVLLDAYDGKGRVPAHLQQAPFMEALHAALAPGGSIIANLWDGAPTASAAANTFAQRLATAASDPANKTAASTLKVAGSGLDVYSLRVVSQEANRVLVALKPQQDGASTLGDGRSAPGARPRVEELKRRMQQAADAHAAAGTESSLVHSMRCNASTLEAWG